MIVEEPQVAVRPRAAPVARAPAPSAVAAPSRVQALVELAKLRISSLVLVTTAVGYLMVGGDDPRVLLTTIVGTALAAVGANSFNQILEVDADRRMHRTRGRPLAERRLSSRGATWFAVAAAVLGVALLASVDRLTAVLGVVTVLLYAAVYTPLKRRTPWCTAIGAVPGALPPVMGTAAATGRIELAGLILFAILFLWQLPHFYAIAWLHRADYARGGFPMLSVVDPSGRRTARQSIVFTALLLAATLAPWPLGAAGPAYATIAAALGAAFLVAVLGFARRPTEASARRVFLGSIAWLPLVLTALAFAWKA